MSQQHLPPHTLNVCGGEGGQSVKTKGRMKKAVDSSFCLPVSLSFSPALPVSFMR